MSVNDFDFRNIENSTISGNALQNKRNNTGATGEGGFIYVKTSTGLNATGNSINHMQDIRKKTVSVDKEPNGLSYIQFDNSKQLNFSQKINYTPLTQTVVRLHNCTNCVVVYNIINYGKGGNAVAETGECKNNFYLTIKIGNSYIFFDKHKYQQPLNQLKSNFQLTEAKLMPMAKTWLT